MKHVLCSNGSWIDGNCSVPNSPYIEVGFMTLISAYIMLFIREESLGGNVLIAINW